MSWYVYKLIDPRDGKPFYVGKGMGNRRHAHVRDAKKGLPGRKCDRIREILAAGLEVEAKIVRDFLIEDDAYAYEAKLIKRIGLHKLTNCEPGGGSSRDPNYVSPRDMVRSCARMGRILAKYKEVGFWFGGKFHEYPRETFMQILWKGVQYVCKELGNERAKAEFAKFNIDLIEAHEA